MHVTNRRQRTRKKMDWEMGQEGERGERDETIALQAPTSHK